MNKLISISKTVTYKVSRPVRVAGVMLLLSACGSGDGMQEALDSAEDMLNRGDIASAVKTVDVIFDSEDTASMDWKDYCRAFIIYSVAFDNSIDSDHALERSERCLASARRLNNDSTATFLTDLPTDHKLEVDKITSILQTLEEARQLDPEDFNTDHDIDPSAPDTHHHDGTTEGQTA
ncbi:MAG: hypothetical protein K2K84_00305 [Muribaculaceae bacterium]|nr:hypothetical protein [Muribaculaceae bacterium]